MGLTDTRNEVKKTGQQIWSIHREVWVMPHATQVEAIAQKRIDFIWNTTHQHDINTEFAVENDSGHVRSCGAGRNRLSSGTREGSDLPRREGLERSRSWPTGVKYKRKILHCTGLIPGSCLPSYRGLLMHRAARQCAKGDEKGERDSTSGWCRNPSFSAENVLSDDG